MDYRDLGFYKKARQATIEVNEEIKTWPTSTQAQTIARQLFRASASIGANIAEGHGSHKGLEYIHYLTIAQGSANEVNHWLNTAMDCKIGHSESLKHLITINDEIRKMLTSTINSLQQKYAGKTIRDPAALYSIDTDESSEENDLTSNSPLPYSPNPYPEEDETK